MNFKEQPCLQVSLPQVLSSHPTVSSAHLLLFRYGLHPSVMHFQTGQVMIQRKILPPPSSPPEPPPSEHFKGKQDLQCPCCTRGELNAECKIWWKAPCRGREVASQTSLLPAIDALHSHTHPGKSFYLLHMSLPTTSFR